VDVKSGIDTKSSYQGDAFRKSFTLSMNPKNPCLSQAGVDCRTNYDIVKGLACDAAWKDI